MFSVMKGPYYRLVGRHTQRYLRRAKEMAGNETQKKILFIAAAGVDVFFSKVFNVQSKNSSFFAKAPVEKIVKKKQVIKAFHLYLSTLLILLGNQKEPLLKETGLDETNWIKVWRKVFDYHDEDIACYNEDMVPAYRSDGLDMLIKVSARLICETLSSTRSTRIFFNESDLQENLMQDMSAVLRALVPKKGV